MKRTALLFFVCFALFSCFLTSIRFGLVGETCDVKFKEWSLYTPKEKEILRNWWSTADVDSVINALKNKKTLPGKVGTLTLIEYGRKTTLNDLRGISFAGKDLSGLDLSSSCLQGADLKGSILDSTVFTNSYLQGAQLQGASLKKAILENTKLHFAVLTGDSMQGAVLRNAILIGADLTESNLRDANLYEATFYSTFLYQVDLTTATNWQRIIWGSKSKPQYVIGEEILADSIKSHEYLQKAEYIYRLLEHLYKDKLLSEAANEFHLRENIVKNKKYVCYDLRRIFRVAFLGWTYGYGSRPMRLIVYSIAVIVGFGLIFGLLSMARSKKHRIIIVKRLQSNGEEIIKPYRVHKLLTHCFYFSMISFSRIGYGALQFNDMLRSLTFEPYEYRPEGMFRIIAGIEALLGAWVLGLLATFLFKGS